MKENRGIFVKVNYKNIGELNSFIYDSMNGINKNKDGSLVGDVSKDAKSITMATKVPGGVGRFTVLSLIENLILLDKMYGKRKF